MSSPGPDLPSKLILIVSLKKKKLRRRFLTFTHATRACLPCLLEAWKMSEFPFPIFGSQIAFCLHICPFLHSHCLPPSYSCGKASPSLTSCQMRALFLQMGPGGGAERAETHRAADGLSNHRHYPKELEWAPQRERRDKLWSGKYNSASYIAPQRYKLE